MLWMIGWTKAWKEAVEVFDVGPRVIVNGLNKVAIRAVMGWLR